MTSASKVFAGVGSRKTPNHKAMPIGDIMGKMAYQMCYGKNWVMTSGGAEGADTFFEKGLYGKGNNPIKDGRFKLFLPYDGFNGHQEGIVIDSKNLLERARKILIEMKVYPQDKKLPRFIELEGDDREKLTKREHAIANLHTRNVFQVLQENLESPIDMLVCWTPDGAISRNEYRMGVTGGTGIAINLAEALGKPVFNMQREDHLKRICAFTEIEMPALEKPLQPGLF